MVWCSVVLLKWGQTVASSFSAPTLFLLARDLKAMEVIVAVDEADIGVIRVGQHATFTVDAYRGRQFQAQVRQIRLANIASTSSSSSAAKPAWCLTTRCCRWITTTKCCCQA